MLLCSMIRENSSESLKEIGAKFFECKNHREHLFFSSRVVALGIIQGFRFIVHDRRSRVYPLSQDGANSIVGGIAHELERFGPIRRLDDWCGD